MSSHKSLYYRVWDNDHAEERVHRGMLDSLLYLVHPAMLALYIRFKREGFFLRTFAVSLNEGSKYKNTSILKSR
jgi:hypothetical protein